MPAETVQQVASSLLSLGKVRRGYLGVSTQPVMLPAQTAQKLGLSQDQGLLLIRVDSESPADRGGLMLGDVLLTFAEQQVRNGDELQTLLGPERVGVVTTAKIIRGGELRDVAITVGDRP